LRSSFGLGGGIDALREQSLDHGGGAFLGELGSYEAEVSSSVAMRSMGTSCLLEDIRGIAAIADEVGGVIAAGQALDEIAFGVHPQRYHVAV
jgi:hypothetical protein